MSQKFWTRTGAQPRRADIPEPTPPPDAEPDNVVVVWNDAALEAVRETHPPPTAVARALAVVNTAVYDAWAAYDATAVGTRLGGSLRRPPAERSAANTRRAVSFAAALALVDLFPRPAQVARVTALLSALGYDPADLTAAGLSSEDSAAVARQAVAALVAYRHADSSNQLGSLGGGVPYGDYSGYVPANSVMTMPSSELPPGHRTLFAKFVSRRDRHTVDRDVAVFFALTNAMLDASVVAWDAKLFYDNERSVTAIHYLYAARTIRA